MVPELFSKKIAKIKPKRRTKFWLKMRNKPNETSKSRNKKCKNKMHQEII